MAPGLSEKLCLIVGVRPNLIKAAPLIAAFQKEPRFQIKVLHTGQHYDPALSRIFLGQLSLGQPDKTFNQTKFINRHLKIGQLVRRISRFLAKNDTRLVIVIGDVDSTLAGALAAARMKLHLIHIEAGLRSRDLQTPEESNRFLVDQLSTLHFTTEPSAKKNLLDEGFNNQSIKYVGNLMIENLINHQVEIDSSPILKKLKLNPKSYLVATIHRYENIASKSNLTKILQLLQALNEKYQLIFPLHPHTLKQTRLFKLSKYLKSLTIVDPLGYFDFMKLVCESRGVITDSGGIQEETTFLGVPCCTLREHTERPITIHQGTNKLFSLNTTIDPIIHHLQHPPRHGKIRYWDNKVSQRIINSIKKRYLKI